MQDPIVSYLIVNCDLKMSVGKLSAQTAHAGQLLVQEYYSIDFFNENGNETINNFDNWLKSDYRKIVLAGNQKIFDKIKCERKDYILVIDAGLTEIDSGSETIIALFPMLKSDCPKLIKRLRLL